MSSQASWISGDDCCGPGGVQAQGIRHLSPFADACWHAVLSTFPFISLTFGVCPVGQAMPMSSQVQKIPRVKHRIQEM